MWGRLHTRGFKIGLIIFFLSLGVKAIFVWHIADYHNPEIWEYGEIANNVIQGKGYSIHLLGRVRPTSTILPIYTFFLAFFFGLIGHNYLMIELAQGVIASASCVLLYFIGRRVFSDSVGVLAGVIFALHPAYGVYSTKIAPETVATFLILLTVLWIFKLREVPTVKNAFWTGAIIGLCLLTRSAMVVFLLLAGIWFVLRFQGPYRTAAYCLLATLITTLLVLSPWVVRNTALHGRVIVFSTDGGRNFWRGNNPAATGGSYTLEGEPIDYLFYQQHGPEVKGLSEAEWERFLYQKAKEFILENPTTFVLFSIKKLFYFWWFTPVAGMLYPLSWLKAYKIIYLGILSFAMVGLLDTSSHSERTVLLLLLFASFSLVHMLFFVNMRHRLLIEPLLLLFTAKGVERVKVLELFEAIRRGRRLPGKRE